MQPDLITYGDIGHFNGRARCRPWAVIAWAGVFLAQNSNRWYPRHYLSTLPRSTVWSRWSRYGQIEARGVCRIWDPAVRSTQSLTRCGAVRLRESDWRVADRTPFRRWRGGGCAQDFLVFHKARQPWAVSPESAINLDASCAALPVKVPIQVTGARAEALVLVNRAEARRRARYQLNAVLNPVLLDACWTIRDRALVRWEELSPHHAEALRHAPAGVLTQLHDRLRVDLLVPVEVIRIFVSGGTWRRLVPRADALRRFAPTTIRVERKVEDDDVWEALFLGVGITGPEGDTDVVAPEPASTWPIDVSRWRLSEICWQQLLEPRPRVTPGTPNEHSGASDMQ